MKRKKDKMAARLRSANQIVRAISAGRRVLIDGVEAPAAALWNTPFRALEIIARRRRVEVEG